MTNIIDFHTHAFPDTLAAKVIPALAKSGDISPALNGTVSDLLASMSRAGIEKSIICSIATRPEQFEPIFTWSVEIMSDYLVPLPSVHPADALLDEHLRMISDQGFKGIKMHPYYQDFFLDEARMMNIYEILCRYELLLVMHTGFDIAFPRVRRADPEKILRVISKFPDLQMITTHFGSWDDWAEVREKLIGKPVYMDLSFSLDYLDTETARRMIMSHPSGYILFGTDSPWNDQGKVVGQLRSLHLDPRLEQQILGGNAMGLLGVTS